MKNLLITSLFLISLPLTVACNSAPYTGQVSEALLNQADVEIETIDNDDAGSAASPSAAIVINSILTEPEISDLSFMREEEKLAHDVYVYLYDRWELNVFQNIAGSEQTHANTILALLNQYGIPDPAEGLAAGQFNNPDLQELYNQLVQQGSMSLADAIKVGAAIEEIDILDLREAITYTNQADILLAYENLLQGSYNHLRAFANTLRQQSGETYQPQYLSTEDYQAIIEGTMGSGMGNSSQGQPNRRGPGNQNTN